MKQYTDKATIENYLNKDIDESFDPQIDEWIAAMTRTIDNLCNRTIFSDEESSERVYDGNGRQKLVIDDFRTLEGVTLDEEELDLDDILRYPANQKPQSILYRKDRFTEGTQNVKVTAEWGAFDELPADVKLACTVLVSGIILQQLNMLGDGQVLEESIGNYRVKYTTEKQGDDYKRSMQALEAYKKILV
jgi:hypothetical protein